MSTPPPHKPKKRTQFGPTARRQRKQKESAEDQQRKVKAWIKFLKP